MPSKQQVQGLLDQGLSYAAIARRLHIPAGQAHLIATGVPADGGDTLTASRYESSGALATSQHLSNPPVDNPTSKGFVAEWIRDRVRADPQLREATGQHPAVPAAKPLKAESGDGVTVLTRQHNALRAAVLKLKTIPGASSGLTGEQARTRATLAEALAEEFTRHLSIESEHLWPVVQDALADGDRWAADAAELDEQGRQALTELVELAVDSGEFGQQVSTVVPRVNRHLAQQERLFLELRATVSRDSLDELGRRLAGAGSISEPATESRSPAEDGTEGDSAGRKSSGEKSSGSGA